MWCTCDRTRPPAGKSRLASLAGVRLPDGAVEPEDPQLRSRLDRVARQVSEAVSGAGRPADGVRLLLATKTIEPARIRQAFAAGFTLIGENRAQEVVAKADELAGVDHECHFIGHLQANKVNQVLPHVSCVQTLDSGALAHRLDTRAAALGRRLDVLIQVNVSGEPSKSGVAVAEIPALLEQAANCRHLRVRGYMTIGLNSDDRAAVRAGYRALTTFRDDALQRGLGGAEQATELSMGMSGDFQDAIAEGATIVRVGSAVFGSRPVPR
jgi:pyridoxal phosphate enzyme (YggS family)